MLQTQRLTCEELKPIHASRLYEGFQDDRLFEFIDDSPPIDLESLHSRYERLAKGKSPDGCGIWLNWAIRLRETEQYFGTVQATVLGDQSALIAYVLFRDAWGQGYAREAVTEVVRHLQVTYSVLKYRATVDPRNIRSIRLLESLGFRQTDYRVQGASIRGIPADEAEYELIPV